MANRLHKYCLLSLLLLVNSIFALAQNATPAYHPSKVVIKLVAAGNTGRLSPNSLSLDQLTRHDAVTGVVPLEKTLPGNVRVQKSKYLDGIHILDINDQSTVLEMIRELSGFENVVYVEPLYAAELLDIPNDPAAQPEGAQYYLSLIKAYEAWDIATGSSDIVIGSVDTGTQLNHSDLADNISFNQDDPINGIDDDNNGYIDDYNGWDIANNDNDPTGDKSRHGTQVAGIHSGVANNGIGMAGVAFDSPFLPVKIFDSEDNRSFNSYGGVIYAADQGVKVMNLSWGSPNSYSQFNQDIINYAALEKDVVIVAAAGNTNEELNFYPASYDNVISVGSSDGSDNKAGYATYSRYIDLLAPGTGIYSTNSNGGYLSAPGSSFASPQVAGAAALVRQVFPDYSARQVAEQLRVTADNIYGVNSNADFLGMLGNGRLNIHAALTQTGTIAMQMEDITVSGLFGDNLFADDTISIGGTLHNYINLATNVSMSVGSESSFATVLTEEAFIGQLATDVSHNFPVGSIKVYLSKDTQKNERIVIRLDFEGNGFSDRQFIVFTANPTFLEIRGGAATVTASDNGNLGYEEDVFKNGKGLRYNDLLVSNQLGLIIATDIAHVADNTVNNFQSDTRDSDFTAEDGLQYLFNSSADDYAEGSFKVSGGQFDLLVEQKILGWEDLDALLLEYRLINTTDSTLTNVYLGALADLNLGFAIENKTAYDPSNNLGYTYDINQEHYVGIAQVSGSVAGFRGVDLGEYNNNTAEIDEALSDSLKFALVSSAFNKTVAGSASTGNYVAQVMSTKFSSLAPNVPMKSAFAYVFGSSLSEIQTKAQTAKARYQQFINSPPLLASYAVCAGGDVTMSLDDGNTFDFYTDVNLSQLAFSGNDIELKDVTNDIIYYLVNKDQGYPGDTRRVTIDVTPTVADFVLPNDSLIIDELSRSLQITDASSNAQQWSWDFGNGVFSTQQSPLVSYSLPGIYDIKLVASSGTGCADSISQKLIVAKRNPKPSDQEFNFCEGEEVNLALDSELIYRLYRDPELTSLVDIGTNFMLEGLTGDTTLYLTNATGALESIPAIISLTQTDFPTGVSIAHDLEDLTSNRSLLIEANVNASTKVNWLIEGESYSGRSINHDWLGAAGISIEMTALDTISGCSRTIEQSISNEVSIAPVTSDTLVCSNLSLQLAPIGKGPFIYYADDNRVQIVYKGTVLNIEGLTGDTVFYVTSVEEIIESTIVPWTVNVEVFQDTIQTDPDMIVLSEDRSVSLNAASNKGVIWQWSVNDSFFESIRSPTLFFDSAGTYNIRLVSLNDRGCKSIVGLAYQVSNVTALSGEDLDVSIYPNPAMQLVNFESALVIESIEVIAQSGANMVEKKIGKRNFQLNISTWDSGQYFVILRLGSGERYLHRLIK
ncbi:MAG: S8 family serine peptidase [Cyclobacteriaceae bacterium]